MKNPEPRRDEVPKPNGSRNPEDPYPSGRCAECGGEGVIISRTDRGVIFVNGERKPTRVTTYRCSNCGRIWQTSVILS